ncbi:integrase core domain-containing protein [Actinomyces sp.]|uniref:integrase core domain-containing protein n=1 Tax=Actinomyces sp. TaxID=29317 RepID=UPI0034220642
MHDTAKTWTGRETCKRETAAWVHWFNTRRPHLCLGGITPQQADNQHTTTRKEAASTSHHKTRDLTHPLRGIAPVTSRCTRYVALHPLRRAAPVT